MTFTNYSVFSVDDSWLADSISDDDIELPKGLPLPDENDDDIDALNSNPGLFFNIFVSQSVG